MLGEDDKKEDIGLPGDEEPVIKVGGGSKMPKTPDVGSIEGLEAVKRMDPFLTPFGRKL
jgi:hypothetical protein